MTKLVFNLVASTYAESRHAQSGWDLFLIFSAPGRNERSQWELAIQQLSLTLSSFDNPIRRPSIMPEPEETLLEYFSHVLSVDYSASTVGNCGSRYNTRSTEQQTSATHDLQKTVHLSPFFMKPANVPAIDMLDTQPILQNIHDLSCFVLFNLLVRRFILGSGRVERTSVATGWEVVNAANILMPMEGEDDAISSGSLDEMTRRDLCFDLNITAHNLKEIISRDSCPSKPHKSESLPQYDATAEFVCWTTSGSYPN